ncbi:MAG: uracil-xanthine permease family protein [Firmicutes bacterium]|nr:uracil-xanthine permease family protein [Bacillota bacterium]
MEPREVQLARQPGAFLLLSAQHLLAMFGATILVPVLTGLNPAVALLTAGLGTLLFHALTGGRVPVFLGSSFAFIPAIIAVRERFGLPYATGGIVVAGFVYVLVAGLAAYFGPDRIRRLVPGEVAGPIIVVIGLTLTPVAWEMARGHWAIAGITIAAIAAVLAWGRGILRALPVMVGLGVGYLAAWGFGRLDTTPVAAAPWLHFPDLMAPAFRWEAILMVAPMAFITCIEHIGDITANGAVVGQNFLRFPGLHRTLLGDGLATSLAGLLGGPANTTYAENTGVLALTRVYNPKILRGAAVGAIALSFLGKLAAVLQSIPEPVLGGTSLVLFGMIAGIGARTFGQARRSLRSFVIGGTVLALGLAPAVSDALGTANPIALRLWGEFTLEGLSLAALAGILLNLCWPGGGEPEPSPAVGEASTA